MAVRICDVDMRKVRVHYLNRKRTHQRLREMFDAENVHEFAQLALGIADASGNYSAAEHGMGPVILSRATEEVIFELATAIKACRHVEHLPRLIYHHSISGLKIAIGSEIALMLRPMRFWVGNVRTIWSHLLIKHGFNDKRANDELDLYEDGERESEMDYEIWRDVYLSMEPSIQTLGRLAAEAAACQHVPTGKLRYMWSDAVASLLFDRFARTRARAR